MKSSSSTPWYPPRCVDLVKPREQEIADELKSARTDAWQRGEAGGFFSLAERRYAKVRPSPTLAYQTCREPAIACSQREEKQDG
jgi:hypothetical protein